ncbi:MAG: hypothetical protein ACD_7C00533G0007 [uncultured bacterium]|nr:MAG: hypothetical protein ACD_7C00533G0007 [uncultured bacterium]HBR79677.1 hypothetical protein [Candidatus Moranbacteria bacterium]
MVKKDFVEKKIDLIQSELARLAEFSDFTLEEVAADFYKYNTLERLLEKIIMRAVDINEHLLSELATEKTKVPETYKETFLELAKLGVYSEEFAVQISRSVGTRNVLVHDYDDDETDYRRIYDSVTDCLKEYHQYCGYILEFLEKK